MSNRIRFSCNEMRGPIDESIVRIICRNFPLTNIMSCQSVMKYFGTSIYIPIYVSYITPYRGSFGITFLQTHQRILNSRRIPKIKRIICITHCGNKVDQNGIRVCEPSWLRSHASQYGIQHMHVVQCMTTVAVSLSHNLITKGPQIRWKIRNAYTLNYSS